VAVLQNQSVKEGKTPEERKARTVYETMASAILEEDPDQSMLNL
jgi:hypothetical protein